MPQLSHLKFFNSKKKTFFFCLIWKSPLYSGSEETEDSMIFFLPYNKKKRKSSSLQVSRHIDLEYLNFRKIHFFFRLSNYWISNSEFIVMRWEYFSTLKSTDTERYQILEFVLQLLRQYPIFPWQNSTPEWQLSNFGSVYCLKCWTQWRS